ncbi:MAG: hypothetical protein D6754_00600 [Alphaproteobacteria bacterium]|nr:MAG: hypothetical protein D6754_00600 [Alphaproteobacteria bacterium]
MHEAVLRALLALVLLAGLAGCESAEERAAAHLKRGQELVAAGQDAKARLEFANVLKIDPDSLPAHEALARLYERQGDGAAMAGHLQRIAERDPANLWAQTRLAELMLGAGQMQGALDHAEAALKAAPDNAEALALRAAAAFSMDRQEEALADAARAVAIEPDQPLAGGVLVRGRVAAKDLAGARALAERYLAAHPENEDLNRLHLGIVLEQQDVAAAGESLARLVALKPDDLDYWTALLQWHLETGDPAGGFARLRDRVATLEDPWLAGRFAELAGLLATAMRENAGAEAARAELARLAETAARPWIYRRMLAAFDYANDRPEAARAALEEMIAKAGPEAAAAARVMLARIELTEGHPAVAATLIEAVLAADAANTEALELRAMLRLKDGQPEAALTDLRLALGEAPDNPGLLTLAAEAQLRLGNRTLAGESLGQAMQATGYAAAETLRYAEFLIEEGRAEAAEAVLSEAAQHRPAERAILLKLADLRLSLGKWLEIEPVIAALRKLDARTEADRLQAALLQSQQRYDESLEILKNLSGPEDTRKQAMGQLIATYLAAGRRGEAEAYLAAVLAETPDQPQALYLSAAMKEDEGDLPAAEALLRRLVAAAPDTVSSHEVLADFLTRHGRPAEAEAATRAGLDRLPGQPVLMLRLAMLREKAGDPEAAIGIYEEMLAAGETSLVVINNLVSLISDHQAGDPERIAHARRIAAPLQGSRNPAFRDTYGWLLHLDGEDDAALAELIPAAHELPDNPWVRYHLGIVLARLGRGEEARTHLEAALKLGGETGFAAAPRIRSALEELTKG